MHIHSFFEELYMPRMTKSKSTQRNINVFKTFTLLSFHRQRTEGEQVKDEFNQALERRTDKSIKGQKLAFFPFVASSVHPRILNQLLVLHYIC